MLFSGLAAQSEISQLLNELYGRLDPASLGSIGGVSIIFLHSGDGVPSFPGKRKSAHEKESIESFALEVKRLRASRRNTLIVNREAGV